MNKWAAYDLFGSMRRSTPAEQKAYEKMKEKYSTSLGLSIWDIGDQYMGDIEIDYCDICHEKTQVMRKYYNYNINCDCCGGQYHFEIVRHCKNCEPKPPKWIKAEVKPIEERKRKIEPENWEYYE